MSDLMYEYKKQKRENDTLIAGLVAQLEIANLQKKYLDDKIVLLNQIVELKREIKKHDPFSFEAFCRARVRVDAYNFVACQANVKDVWVSYITYIKSLGDWVKKPSREDFAKMVEEKFGKPERPLFQETPVLKGVYAFFDQESVDEYDQEVLKSKV